MATDRARIIFLDTLVERCESFITETREVNSLHHPSDAPRILASCLYKAADKVTERIKELRRSYTQASESIKNEIMAEAATMSNFIVFNSSLICPMLRNASIENVPAEMVLPTERIARLVFPDCQVIIECVAEHNYYFREIGNRILNSFSSVDLEDILLQEERFPNSLFRLQVCLNPPCGIFLHCLLGHEIGHAIYKARGVSSNLLPSITFNEQAIIDLINARFQQLQEDFAARARRVPTQTVLDQTRGFMEYITKMETLRVSSKWIEELFCDCIGTGLFGPAFVCASSMFLLPLTQIDDSSDSHPSNRLRVQLSINALERSDPGFCYRLLYKPDSQDDLEPLIKPWKQFIGVRRIPPQDPVHKIAFEAVINIKDKIIREAKSALGDKYFHPSSYSKEVPLLRKRLRDWLPPNEYQIKAGDKFSIASLQGIFNSGWLSYIEDMPDFINLLQRLSESEIKSRFYGLVSKGIESSEIQLRWERAKNELR